MKKFTYLFLLVTGFISFIASCANPGTPDGGPYDETPPKLLKTIPVAGAVHAKQKKITLIFDEYVKIENANEKVIVSPPQLTEPEIEAYGRKVTINLSDSLKANTTYTIDFSDAIEDNNEGNPLGNYAYTFSTGASIDTMEVSGTILDASNLEPIKGILVGLHSDLNDSAFRKKPFDRVARTDSWGHFVIKGIAKGKYRVYALMDADQDFKFSQQSELMAFNKDIIEPYGKPDVRQDTSWVDSLHYDSITVVNYTHYYPDDIVLKAFRQKMTDRYLVRSNRPDTYFFNIVFSTWSDSLPQIKGLNFNEKNAFFIDKPKADRDSITYWIRDSLLYQKDSLNMTMTYLHTDSLGKLVPQTDTLLMIPKIKWARVQALQKEKVKDWMKEQKKNAKKGLSHDSIMPPDPLAFDVQNTGSTDPDKNPVFVFKEPVTKIDTSKIHLELKVDTLYHPARFLFRQRPDDLKSYELFGEWRMGQEYKIKVDSAAFTGLYGKVSKPYEGTLTLKKDDSYSTLYLKLMGTDSCAIVQLLDKSDKVIKEAEGYSGQANFYYITPGEYYLRLYLDRNHNHIWDTGDFSKDLQPEEVYYYPGMLKLKAQWEFDQTWDINTTPFIKQKPIEITKQKPDAAKTIRNRNAERARNLHNN